MTEISDSALQRDPFAHLKRRASERADRTVERIRAGIAALRAARMKITAESLKHATREMEPGFAGLSFQVIRRNPVPTNSTESRPTHSTLRQHPTTTTAG